ncbi:hypothetical protein CYMTET_31646, partial [Cymbomonas tetramitiformis]
SLIYAFYDAFWVLPAFGFLVGWATNFLALFVIFNPVKPIEIRVCGWHACTLHGVFMKRQDEVSTEFSKVVCEVFVNAVHLWEEMLFGEKSEAFFQLLRKHTNTFIDELLGSKKVFVNLLLGTDKFERIRAGMVNELCAEFENVIPYGYAYTDEAMRMQETIEEKMKGLSPEDFEGVLHPAFEEDEIKLIAVGGLFGAIIGLIQEYIFSFLVG